MTIPNIGSWWTLAHLKTSAFRGFSGASMWFMTTGVVFGRGLQAQNLPVPGSNALQMKIRVETSSVNKYE